MSAFRYWRLYITRTMSSANAETDIAELVLRTVAGGAQVATGGTASADSEYSAAYTAARAFDGLIGSANTWASANTPAPHWVKYDLGAGNQKDIVEFVITSIPTGGWSSYTPSTFELQCSNDDVTWYTARAVYGENWTASSQARTFGSHTPGSTLDLTKMNAYYVRFGSVLAGESVSKINAYAIRSGINAGESISKLNAYAIRSGINEGVSVSKMNAYVIYRP